MREIEDIFLQSVAHELDLRHFPLDLCNDDRKR